MKKNKKHRRILAQGDMFAVGREGISRRWTRLYNGVSDGAGRGRLSVRSVVITLESPEDRCFEMEITAAVDHLVTLRQKRVKWPEQHHSLRPLCSVPARGGGRSGSLCGQFGNGGERGMVNPPRLTPARRDLRRRRDRCPWPGRSVSGAARREADWVNRKTQLPRLFPCACVHPSSCNHATGEGRRVCVREKERERERSQEQSEGASSEVKNFAGHRSSRLWPPQCPHGRSRRSVRIDGQCGTGEKKEEGREGGKEEAGGAHARGRAGRSLVEECHHRPMISSRQCTRSHRPSVRSVGRPTTSYLDWNARHCRREKAARRARTGPDGRGRRFW